MLQFEKQPGAGADVMRAGLRSAARLAVRVERLVRSRSSTFARRAGAQTRIRISAFSRPVRQRDSIVSCQRELMRCRGLGDREAEARQLNRLAGAYRRGGHLGEAVVCSLQALATGQELSDSRLQAASLNALGLSYAKQGSTSRAVSCYAQASEIFRALDEPQIEGEILANLGRLYRSHGREDDAMRLLREAHEKLHPESSARRRVEGWLQAAR